MQVNLCDPQVDSFKNILMRNESMMLFVNDPIFAQCTIAVRDHSHMTSDS